jgi:hypothetical protein
MPVSRRACEAAAIAIALAIVAVMAVRLANADGLLLANGQPVFGDFIAFWSAGRAALEGHAAQVHDIALIRRYHEIAVPGVGFVAPWNAPPTLLLSATALAHFPYPTAAILFLALSGGVYLFAARAILPDARALIFAATLPAAVYHLGTVQLGLFVAGVSALALHWLDRRPFAAGALVSLLAIKPHLAILWPFLLVLSGRWRAFAAASLATLAFAGVAGLAFGFDSWLRFLTNLPSAQALVSGQRVATPAYASLYANLLQMGAPQALAITAHAASALAASGLAMWLFRGAGRGEQGAALCAATLIALPYVFFYDFVLLAAGAALLGAPRDRLETVAATLAWAAGLSLALGHLAPAPLCPLAAWLVLIAAFRRTGNAAPRPAQAPRR